MFLGAAERGAFLWVRRHHQFEAPKGDAERMLSKEWDDHPKPPDDPRG